MRKKINKLNRKKIKNLINFIINETNKEYNIDENNNLFPYQLLYFFRNRKKLNSQKLNSQSYLILFNLFDRMKIKLEISKKEFYTILNNL